MRAQRDKSDKAQVGVSLQCEAILYSFISYVSTTVLCSEVACIRKAACRLEKAPVREMIVWSEKILVFPRLYCF